MRNPLGLVIINGFAGQSEGSVYNRAGKIIALQPGEKKEPSSPNAQVGK